MRIVYVGQASPEPLISSLGAEAELEWPDTADRAAAIDSRPDVVLVEDALFSEIVNFLDASTAIAVIDTGSSSDTCADVILEPAALDSVALSFALELATARAAERQWFNRLADITFDSSAFDSIDSFAEAVAAKLEKSLDCDGVVQTFELTRRGKLEVISTTTSDALAAIDPLVLPVGRQKIEVGGASASGLVVRLGGSETLRGAVLFVRRRGEFRDLDARRAVAATKIAETELDHGIIVRERDRAIEVRERVLATTSHDLRTPLAVIEMSLELLTETSDEAERALLRERAERALKRTRRLVDDLLDYSAVDAGTLRIEATPTSPEIVARRALDTVRGVAEAKKIGLALEASPGLSKAEVDGGRLVQALTNLLDNAVRHTPVDGEIRVSVTETETSTTFVVTDNGPGIAEEKQRVLFDRFYSGAKGGSAGLGLTIARGIAEGHGGALLVESSPGRGASFFLTVPKAQPE